MADYVFKPKNVYDQKLLTISIGTGATDTLINCKVMNVSDLNFNFKKVTDPIAGSITLTFSHNENFTNAIYTATKNEVWTITVDSVDVFKGVLDKQSVVSKINDYSSLEKGVFSLRLAGVDITKFLPAINFSTGAYISSVVSSVVNQSTVFRDDFFVTLTGGETCHMVTGNTPTGQFYFETNGLLTTNYIKTLRKMFNFNILSWNGNTHVFSRRQTSTPVVISISDLLTYSYTREFTSDNYNEIYSSEDYRLWSMKGKENKIQVFDNDIIITDKNHINSWDNTLIDWLDNNTGVTARNNYSGDAYNIVTASNNPAILAIGFNLSDTAYGIYDRLNVIELGETMYVSFMIHNVQNFKDSTANFIYGWIASGREVIDFTDQVTDGVADGQMIYLSFKNKNYDKTDVQAFSTNIVAVEFVKGAGVGSNNITFGLSDVWIGRSTDNQFNQVVQTDIVTESPYVDIVPIGGGTPATKTISKQAEFKYRLLQKTNAENLANEGTEFKKHATISTKQSIDPWDLISLDSTTYRILEFNYNIKSNITTLELLED